VAAVSRALDGLSATGREAATHGVGPLLLHGGPGSGLSRALVARVGWLVEHGEAPEGLLVLAAEPASARRLRTSLEAELDGPYEELAVHTVTGLCGALLAGEAPAAGLDPFAVPAGVADRLALLLEHAGELELRFHDTQGRPAVLLQAVVERIDGLKGELVEPEAFARWAAALPRTDEAQRARADREGEFAELYRLHERLLADAGVLDAGGLLLRCRALLAGDAGARQRICARWRHILVDELADLSFGELDLVCSLSAEHRRLWACGDPDTAVRRLRGATAKNAEDLRVRFPDLRELSLEQSLRCPQDVLRAAQAVIEPVAAGARMAAAGPGGDVAFWRCASERAQAQAVAAEIERRVSQEGVDPEDCCVLVRSARREGAAIALALEERAVPHTVVGAGAFFQRAEVRDVLAWLRLLVDPTDAGAAVRALARPPIELRAADLARCTQIARRRRLDMVTALVAATESPQIPPEARERILRFLKLHRSAAAALDTTRPDLFVHRLVERLGLRRQQLFTAQADVVQRLVNLARLAELAAAYVGRAPQATPREFARYVAAVAEVGIDDDRDSGDGPAGRGVRVMSMAAARGREFACVWLCGMHAARMPGARGQAIEPIADGLLPETLPPETRETHVAVMRRLCHLAMTRSGQTLIISYAERSTSGAVQPPSPFAEEAREALGQSWQERTEELFGPAEGLQAAYGALRDELLTTVGRVGGRLGELRFDTDLDIAHAVVRYLELLKLSALLGRPAGQSVDEALAEINLRLAQATTAQQREILESSPLDERLLGAEQSERRRAQVAAAAAEPSLEPFLPRRGDGLLLSASDIDTYRICPLRYKFARVFRIPQEPTANQRFGILVHQVLERFHGAGEGGRSGSLAGLLGLLDAGWRRSGFGSAPDERRLRAKATAALTRYHERFESEESDPVWFERSFAFRLGGHWLRGRVDRVDRLPDGGYELIDYKTGRPKTAAQLRDDVQLSLYAVGAQEAWHLDAAAQSYYYVLDDEKVAVPRDAGDRDWIEQTVAEVAEGILGQGFEPTPSYAACSACDYRIACPAAER